MRGLDAMSGSLLSYVDIEARIPTGHPIRIIGRIVNEVLVGLDAEFAVMYSGIGRPSIAPEKLLRGSLLQIIFSVRSERQLTESVSRAYSAPYSTTGTTFIAASFSCWRTKMPHRKFNKATRLEQPKTNDERLIDVRRAVSEATAAIALEQGSKQKRRRKGLAVMGLK
jgi:hypothetical protein